MQHSWPAFGAFIGVRTHHAVGHGIIDAVALRFPSAAAVEAIVASSMLADAGTFQRVPVPIFAVHQSVFLEALPIVARAQNDSSRPSQIGHAAHRTNDESSPGAEVVVLIQKIAGIEQIPAAIVVLERMRIDRKGANPRIDESLAAIFVRADGRLRGRDAELMAFVLKADRVVEVKPAIIISHFGCPEVAPESWVGPHQRVAGELPMEKVGRAENGKNLADGMPGGLQFARANGVVVILMFPDEGISEIPGVNWIPMRSDGIGSKHTANVRPTTF